MSGVSSVAFEQKPIHRGRGFAIVCVLLLLLLLSFTPDPGVCHLTKDTSAMLTLPLTYCKQIPLNLSKSKLHHEHIEHFPCPGTAR